MLLPAGCFSLWHAEICLLVILLGSKCMPGITLNNSEQFSVLHLQMAVAACLSTSHAIRLPPNRQFKEPTLGVVPLEAWPSLTGFLLKSQGMTLGSHGTTCSSLQLDKTQDEAIRGPQFQCFTDDVNSLSKAVLCSCIKEG